MNHIDKGKQSDNIQIIEVKKTSAKILASLQHLLPQLTADFKSFDMSSLEEIVDSDSTLLFIAIDLSSEDQIVGTYTLVSFRIPTGYTIRIEDVIVDENRRGEGIGKKMMHHAINFAKNTGATKIELASHESRIEANKLYLSLGFKKIETNVYRYKI
ncbi:MAG: GNAT family N-acetyltransferase [Calditrichia bacterium]|nr:GNAT family N-acetyltransferase [Calditrichia bacterium]